MVSEVESESEDTLLETTDHFDEWNEDSPPSPRKEGRVLIPILDRTFRHIGDLMDIMKRLPEAQREDSELMSIISHLNNLVGNTGVPKWAETIHRFSLGHRSRILIAILQDDCNRFLVPQELKGFIREVFHTSPVLGCHPSPRTTAQHIQRYFFWKNPLRDVRPYCASCQVCAKANRERPQVY